VHERRVLLQNIIAASEFGELARLFGSVSESLHREMYAGFAALSSQLDRIIARLDRIDQLLVDRREDCGS